MEESGRRGPSAAGAPRVRRCSSPNRRGFTLTELLVSIAILIVLAALAFTVFGRLRNAADKSVVVRNLSQIQMANASYAADHAGKYIPYLVNDQNGNRAGFWYQVTEFLTYLRGEVMDRNGAPSKSVELSLLDPKVVRARRPFYYSMAGSYGLNNTGLPTVAGQALAAPCHNVHNVTQPAASMAFSTATDVRVVYNARFNWFNRGGVEGKTSDGAMAYRHGNKAVVVYFDGHVGEVTRQDIEAIDRSRGGQNAAFWRPDPK